MQHVGFGDILFIVLILGVIHGIMTLVGRARSKKGQTPPAGGPGRDR
ncbi:MAG: hypothetical protein RQ723_09920 [Desulfuromonadales bacterium]|nr:hypothetical protein [Desulfuromonadales bacterium]